MSAPNCLRSSKGAGQPLHAPAQPCSAGSPAAITRWMPLLRAPLPTRFTLVLLAAIMVLGASAASSSAKTRPDRVVASQASALRRLQATAPGVSSTGPILNQSGCEANVLPANDDGSTEEVDLPFELNFFGSQYSSLWVNNNGNVTFGGPLGTYTPFNIEATTPPMIAPFFADVDTRGAGSGLVTYGTTTFEGHVAFCVDWLNVGYYSEKTDKLDDFQLLLVNRSDAAPGDFDIVFNYGQIEWETGEASYGVDGLGGISAGAGYSNGDGEPGDFYQLPGSLENGDRAGRQRLRHQCSWSLRLSRNRHS